MAEKNYKGYPDPSRVISVEEAMKLQKDRDVVFVDTRNYWKYVEGHIPGAVDLELFAFHWFDTSKQGLKIFAGEMAKLFGAYGIGDRKKVIFYQEESGYDAARGVWLLEFLGNKNGRMLDGGLRLWKEMKGGISKSDSDFRRAKLTARPNARVVVGLDRLGRIARSGRSTILDVRSRGEYDGTYRRALKKGHVPGAVNIEWSNVLRKDGTLKDAKELAALYGAVPHDGEVVTYCQSGYRASHSWLVLKLLGFGDVKSYLGSWYEWGNDPSTEVEM